MSGAAATRVLRRRSVAQDRPCPALLEPWWQRRATSRVRCKNSATRQSGDFSPHAHGSASYRLEHADLGPGHSRGQSRRSRGRRPRLPAAPAAGAAGGDSGREVSADRLIDGLWGEGSPSGATATLHSHVARLRRDLPCADVVRTGRHGYVLDVTEDDVDAFAFERDVARGGRALAEGRLDDASEAAGQGPEPVAGTPYAEFVGCGPLEAEGQRLSALRLDAVERRISADLGRPGVPPPVAELEALVRWHPMRESFWALLMAAQYRAGRQGEALASYRRARATLADELGVEPGPGAAGAGAADPDPRPGLDAAGLSTFIPTRREPCDLLLSRWHSWSGPDQLEDAARPARRALEGLRPPRPGLRRGGRRQVRPGPPMGGRGGRRGASVGSLRPPLVAAAARPARRRRRPPRSTGRGAAALRPDATGCSRPPSLRWTPAVPWCS